MEFYFVSLNLGFLNQTKVNLYEKKFYPYDRQCYARYPETPFST